MRPIVSGNRAAVAVLFAFIMLVAVPGAWADTLPAKKTADPAARSRVIDEILDLSGVKKALKSVPGQIEEEMANPDGEYGKLPDAQREQLRAIMLEAFSPERLVGGMKQTLVENYRQPLYEAVRAQLNSPQGRRLTELEAQLTVADIQERLLAYGEELAKAPAKPERMKLIAALDKTALTSETILDLSVATFAAVALAAREEAALLDEKALQKSLAGIRARLRPAIASQTALMLLYVHRDVSDRDLQGFIRFYQDKNMTVMSGIVRKGFGRAMNDGYREMLKRARNIRGDAVRT